MDYQVLKTELTTDPLVRGYSAMTDAEAAADLNTVYRTRTRPFVYGWEILNETDDTEFGALTDVQKNQWLSMCGTLEIDTGSGVAKSLEATFFGAGTTTRTNLQAIRIEDISRAVEIVGADVKTGDVGYARSL